MGQAGSVLLLQVQTSKQEELFPQIWSCRAIHSAVRRGQAWRVCHSVQWRRQCNVMSIFFQVKRGVQLPRREPCQGWMGFGRQNRGPGEIAIEFRLQPSLSRFIASGVGRAEGGLA